MLLLLIPAVCLSHPIVQLQAANLPTPVAWPSIHAPWYAYLAWTILAHGDYKKLADTTFVGAKVDNMQFCKANMKVRSGC
jgi:hypothetical protein